jgi:hypothetical protein
MTKLKNFGKSTRFLFVHEPLGYSRFIHFVYRLTNCTCAVISIDIFSQQSSKPSDFLASKLNSWEAICDFRCSWEKFPSVFTYSARG